MGECVRRSHQVPGVRRQRHQWLWHSLVRDERRGDLLRQRRRRDKVQEDLRSLRLALLHTSAATTHMTSRAGGAAEDAAAVMHLDLLTPARRPDPRSSDVRLYIYIYSSDPNRNIASEANQNDVKDDHFGLGCGLNKFSYFR